MKHPQIVVKNFWHCWVGYDSAENAIALEKTFVMENSSDLSQCHSQLVLLLNGSVDLNISRTIVCGSVINSKAPSVHKTSLYSFSLFIVI